MIYFDGKIYRNLEEQVLKNMKDLEIYSAGGDFNLKGIVASYDELPESPEKMDYFLVGTDGSYQLYLYYDNGWYNLGDYPKEGPQGPQGIKGDTGATGATGAKGEKGDSLVYEILDIVESTDDLPDPSSVNYWDAYLVGSGIPYMAYFVINGVWTPVGYITPQEAENVVTAENLFNTSDRIIVSAGNSTRKIKETNKYIQDSYPFNNSNSIPTGQAVTQYIQSAVTQAVKFKGSITFAKLAELASAAVGDLYNITDAFVLSGKSYAAGTNLVCIQAFANEQIIPTDATWDAYGESTIDLSPYIKNYSNDSSQWDTTPTAYSTKPVTSDGVKNAIDNAQETIESNQGNNFSFSYNLIVNGNGFQFDGYKFEDVTLQDYPNYTIKQFQVNTTSAVVTDLSIIKNYLSVMTGRNKIPVYDLDKPSDEYIICSSNNTIWKLQYDSANGLLAFKVTNIPSVFGGTKLYLHLINNTQYQSGTEIFLVLIDNNPNSYSGITFLAYLQSVMNDYPRFSISMATLMNGGFNKILSLDTTNYTMSYVNNLGSVIVENISNYFYGELSDTVFEL